jgi:hypothetical protein
MQTPYTKASSIYAMLFFHLAAEFCRTFGEAGEAALRDAVKKFGVDRGKTARADHEQRGYPVHLKTLFSIGGFPGVAESFKRNIIDWQPYQRISEIIECPLCEQWKLMGGLKEGRIYCEEIYKPMWSAYDGGIETKQRKIKTRGDDVCRFEVAMPAAKDMPEAEEFDEVPLDEALGHLMDIQAKMYYYLAKGLCGFGLEGEAALRRAVRLYGRERGLNIRRDHLARGLEINLKSLFNHYDLYSHIDPRIKKNQREFTEESRINESLNCTLFDIWKQYPDGIDIGRIYCEEVHHQIYGGYDSAVQINLTHTLTRGDDRCRFSTYLRPANKISPPTWHVEYNKKISAANTAAD